MDSRLRQRFSSAAGGRNGGRPADAEEGTGQRHAERDGATEGGDEGRREQERNSHRTGESASGVRALVRPCSSLRPRRLSVSVGLLSVVGLLCGGRRHVVWFRDDDGRLLGRRGGGVGLWVGRQ